MLGLERGEHEVIGPASGGGEYFRARAVMAGTLPERPLPELTVIREHAQWLDALESPLGPSLKKAWEAED